MAKIFFSGIGGSGMSAMAGFLADKGNIIAGSDRLFDRIPDHPLSAVLKFKGIEIVPHDGSGIDRSFDFAVFSTAVEKDQPDAVKARQLGITVKLRPYFLNELISSYKTLAVAGTSGKSTTAGMLAFLMQRLGLNPNFIGGGRVKHFKSPDNLGNSLAGSSDFLIAEACESDGSIIDYHPFHAIIMSLTLDHNPVEKTALMFEALSNNTKGLVVVNADDSNLVRCNFKNQIKFSIHANSEYRAEDIEYRPLGTTFQLKGVNFRLSLPGEHNLYNALSCIALLSEMGVRLSDMPDVLADFSGLDRRFDIHLNDGRHLVVDDYAHNPHKISFLMETVKNICLSACYVFQPHGFGPTRLMKQGYIDIFVQKLRGDDHLILFPIYYAGGSSQKDISSDDLCREIRAAGKSVEVLKERSFLLKRLREWDNYIIFGARDESLADFAGEIASRLK
ncbi:MAG: Mur ligase family protein [Nitrospirota bacterium]